MKGKTITDSAEALGEGVTLPPSEKAVHNPRKPKIKKGKTKDTGGTSGAETKSNKTDRKPVLLAVAKRLLEVEGLLSEIGSQIAESWPSGGRKVMRLYTRTSKLAFKIASMASK